VAEESDTSWNIGFKMATGKNFVARVTEQVYVHTDENSGNK